MAQTDKLGGRMKQYENAFRHKLPPQCKSFFLEQRDINWNDLPVWQKRGLCIVKEEYPLEIPHQHTDKCILRCPIVNESTTRTRWVADHETPISQDRQYIERYVYLSKEG